MIQPWGIQILKEKDWPMRDTEEECPAGRELARMWEGDPSGKKQVNNRVSLQLKIQGEKY